MTSAAAALAVLGLAAGLAAGPVASRPAAAITAPMDLGTVQSLYGQDLLARMNAERAARGPAAAVPPLAVDTGLAAAAQSWSAHLAATGVVADPAIAPCTGPGGGQPAPGQLCELAANAGSSGSGFWPGDGSDGMAQAYMVSAVHRENMLGAQYTAVGIGVTCARGQAWTVELFGFVYGDYAAARARQAAQGAIGPAPVVAGTATGVPVYCPGQAVGPGGLTTAAGGLVPYPYPVPGVPGTPVAPLVAPTVGMAATPTGQGYWVARADGSLAALGDAPARGSLAGTRLAAPVRRIVATPSGQGYWLVAADGGIFAFGDATFHGSMGGVPLNAPIVGMAPTPTGRGYWLAAADGGIFAFGDAAFAGSAGGLRLNAPVVGMTPTPSGHGYWMVGTDGGIFAFGDAAFHGSTGSLRLNAPIVGMAADAVTGGYWLVAADGGIFAFGAPFEGTA